MRMRSEIGWLIYEKKQKTGITNVQIAKYIGVSPKYLSAICRGHRTGEKYKDEIAKFLEIDLIDLIKEGEKNATIRKSAS